ncbi:beta-ketoacyl synthase N-terminal-like domain-containing protein [Brevibacillus fulvus]|uniref:Beta-ketoacyl synthase-like N-terminal domain-containing protein n=1 Tax=Brevibacillus fulvus TaxID=1125967 RepID=A0A938XXI1_9BACL|nr:beta-ketoacyl synthase N-terminal-like domain-containing protein [Brevibacillus fulvus]MBM7589691.1 hypothetical protein [Brevibacillus fulvus]
MEKIYVTGTGVLTTHGFGVKQLPEIAELDKLRQTLIPAIAPADYGWRGLKNLSRSVQVGCMTIGQALFPAGIPGGQIKPNGKQDRVGLLIGTNHGNLEAIASLYDDSQKYGVQKVNPGIFPETVLNVIGGHASIYFGFSGTNVTISCGHLSAIKALDYACLLLERKQLDRAIVCLVNIMPPDVFAQTVFNTLPSFEQVVALVLERQETCPQASMAVQVAVELVSDSEPAKSLSIPPEHTVLAVAIAEEKLRNYREKQCCLLVSCGREGNYHVRLTREGSDVSR